MFKSGLSTFRGKDGYIYYKETGFSSHLKPKCSLLFRVFYNDHININTTILYINFFSSDMKCITQKVSYLLSV